MQGKNPLCFGAIIRHGERADHVANCPSPNGSDPPLTPDGFNQATLTGQFLCQYFQKNNMKFDKVIIETSPFIRTMMTAGQIAKAGLVKDVTVNYQASELLETYLFRKDPLPLIEWTQNGKSYDTMKQNIRKAYNEQFWEEGVSFHAPTSKVGSQVPKYPEETDEANIRALNLLNHMNQMLLEHSADGSSVCYLVVSHGHFVSAFTHILSFA